MSASSLRYQLRDDGNGRLRERLTELAGQHCGHGYRMLHSRLRIDGWTINVKLGLTDRRLDATSDGFRLRSCENSVFAWSREKSTFQNGPGSTIGIAGGAR